MIKAITFDLWDTVIRDDSDEPKRRAGGLPSKRETRRQRAWEIFDAQAPLERGRLETAYDTMEAAFNHVWHTHHVTWTVRERIEVLSRGLDRPVPEDAGALVRELEEMEIVIAPDPIEGIAAAIDALAGRYRLAVVSDAIYSPGRCLRQWLAMHGLERHFEAFAFSDEVGRSKPHRAMFTTITDALGVEFEEMVHIGDRDHNDVKGPHALGMKAVLFTASRDADRDATTADATCGEARDLPDTIARVANA